MSVGKNNNKNKKESVDGCCAGMAEIIGEYCPSGMTRSDCFTRMKEMKKFWCPEKNKPANRKK